MAEPRQHNVFPHLWAYENDEGFVLKCHKCYKEIYLKQTDGIPAARLSIAEFTTKHKECEQAVN